MVLVYCLIYSKQTSHSNRQTYSVGYSRVVLCVETFFVDNWPSWLSMFLPLKLEFSLATLQFCCHSFFLKKNKPYITYFLFQFSLFAEKTHWSRCMFQYIPIQWLCVSDLFDGTYHTARQKSDFIALCCMLQNLISTGAHSLE